MYAWARGIARKCAARDACDACDISLARASRRNAPQGARTSWCDVIDHDVDEPVVAHEIRYLAERIAAARDRITRAGNSRHHLYFLTCGKRAPGHHRIRRCQLHGLRKAIRESFCCERRTGLGRIAHEHEEWRCVGS